MHLEYHKERLRGRGFNSKEAFKAAVQAEYDIISLQEIRKEFLRCLRGVSSLGRLVGNLSSQNCGEINVVLKFLGA
jgi:hypothetical protein